MPRLGLGSKIRERLVTYLLEMVERPRKRPFDQAYNSAGGVMYLDHYTTLPCVCTLGRLVDLCFQTSAVQICASFRITLFCVQRYSIRLSKING